MFCEVKHVNSRKNVLRSVLSGQRALFFILVAAFFFGSLLGCLFSRSLADGAGVLEYIKCSGAMLEYGVSGLSFLSVLYDTFRISLIVILSGFAAAGPVLIPVVLFARGFCLCYAISVFYSMSGFSGLFAGAALFGISACLWMPALFNLSFEGMKSSCQICARIFGDRRARTGFDPKLPVRFAVSAGLLLLCSLLEFYIIPAVLPVVIDFL